MNRSSADLIIPLKQCLLNMRERTILIFHIVVMISDANLEVGVIFQEDIWDAPTKNITYDLHCSQHHIQGSDVHLIAGLVSNLSENGVIGMIAFTSCPVAAVLETKSKEINLPLINIVNSFCPESLNRQRSFIFSNCFLQNSIVMSLAQLMQWQRINIIYDSSSDLCIQRLVNLLSVQNISSSAIYLYNGLGFIREWFQKLWLKEVFYVTADRETTLRIISEAMSSDMFNRGYHWVLNLDPKELLNNSIYEPLHNGNVLLVSPYNERKEMTTGNLLDDALSTFSRGLNAIDESNSTNIISLRNDLQESLSREFHNLSAKWKGQASARVLSSVRNNKTPFQEVAVYSQTDESLHLIEKDCLYKNDFKDFGNRALKVVSVVGEPFQMRVDKGNGSFYYHGFTYDLLDEFAKKFNFRYEFLDSVDGLYGNPTDDGQNASGMVGMVMRGEADIAVGGFTITAERRKVVDFIYPFQEEGIGIIMQKVDKLADEMFRVFSPFEIDSWIATIAAVFVAAAVLSLIVKFSPFSRKLHSEVSTSFWVAFSAFLQQGEEKAPNSIPGRVVLGIWWIFTIIIMSLYTANLAAFLTISMAKVPIKNLEELASQRVYKPLVKDGTNLYMLFKDAEGGVYKKIWDMMTDMPKIITPDEGYDMIVQGKYAYMTDESETRYKAMMDCKNLEMADETFHKAELSFVIQKNAEFKEAFNEHMLKMVQSGIVDKYKKKWWPNIDCHYTNTATELAFQSTSGIFIMYSGFILISVICCIAELLIYRRKNEKNKVDSSEETVDANSIVMVDLK